MRGPRGPPLDAPWLSPGPPPTRSADSWARATRCCAATSAPIRARFGTRARHVQVRPPPRSHPPRTPCLPHRIRDPYLWPPKRQNASKDTDPVSSGAGEARAAGVRAAVAAGARVPPEYQSARESWQRWPARCAGRAGRAVAHCEPPPGRGRQRVQLGAGGAGQRRRLRAHPLVLPGRACPGAATRALRSAPRIIFDSRVLPSTSWSVGP